MKKSDHSQPTPEDEERELEALAMNIVFQICDTVVPDDIEGVKIRQANNDKMIDFVMGLIKSHADRDKAATEQLAFMAGCLFAGTPEEDGAIILKAYQDWKALQDGGRTV